MLVLDRRSFFTGAVGALAAPIRAASAPTHVNAPTQVKQNPALVANRSRNVAGKLLYIGDDGVERGREWFSFTYRKDKQVTLRAYCEIDDTRVERDVVQTMNERFHPLDCFVRLHVKGEFLGTGWIRVTDSEAECEVASVVLGRVHQVIPLPARVTSLVSHPITADGLLMAAFDHSRPERIQTWAAGLSTSPLLDGASGPFLAAGRERSVEYVGPEKITTPAGAFDTHHYRLLMGKRPDGRQPSYDLWCTHPDFLVVRGEVGNYLSNATGSGRYELVELETPSP
jgi:hypothetical protein